MSKLYIAYGSNLNKKQMKIRCPDATFVGAGIIHDFQLLFRGGKNAVATIEPCEKESVQAGLWKISKEDEYALDRYEGYPTLYYKKSFKVQLNGERVEAMAYIMDPQYIIGAPSASYYQTIVQGYQDCNLDVTRLNQAVQKCVEAYDMQKLWNDPGMRMK